MEKENLVSKTASTATIAPLLVLPMVKRAITPKIAFAVLTHKIDRVIYLECVLEMENMNDEKKFQNMMAKLPINVRRQLEEFFTMECSNMSILGKSGYVKAFLSLLKVVNKPLKKLNKKDFVDWCNYLDSKGYSQATKAAYKVCIKRFYAWLYNCEEGEYPKVVKWMRISTKRNNELRDKLISEEEVLKLIESADHYRDKALIAVLYESACRISELLTLRIKHVKFDQYGALILVTGKTGERPIRLINSVPYLQAWLNVHPLKNNQEALVFTRQKGSDLNRPLERDYMDTLFKKLCKRAGIRKVHPHMFRHSRLTKLATKLKEPELRLFAGWTASSEMPATYVHLAARDIDEAVRRAEGITELEEIKPEPSKLAPKKCPRCGILNPADFKFCGNCSMVLDLKAAMEIENAQRVILKALNDQKVLDAINTILKIVMPQV